MSTNKTKLEQMLDAFDAAYPGQGKALAAILDDTPQLKARFNQAAEAGQLTGFDSTGAGGDGLYNSRSASSACPATDFPVAVWQLLPIETTYVSLLAMKSATH